MLRTCTIVHDAIGASYEMCTASYGRAVFFVCLLAFIGFIFGCAIGGIANEGSPRK